MSKLTKTDAIKQQILLNISDDSFIIHHTDTMDILDVYLVLVAAIEYIEAEATGLAKLEGKYLQ
jgi:hypothetical protein